MKDPFESILSSSTDKMKTWVIKQDLGEGYTLYRQAKSVLEQSGIQARLPYIINIQ